MFKERTKRIILRAEYRVYLIEHSKMAERVLCDVILIFG